MSPPAPVARRDQQVTRKLVTVKCVTDVRPINGTRLDVITVDRSWTVVAHRNHFKTGQIVVYFEIDSFIPSTAPHMWEYSHHFSTFDGQRGCHVRSGVIKGVLWQGAIFHIEAFDEIEGLLKKLEERYGSDEGLEMIMDMSFEEKLGVKKWEILDDPEGTIIGPAPMFFPRPGAPRAQNIPYIFDGQGIQVNYQITEKLDGVSMTVYCVKKDSPWCRALPELAPGADPATSDVRVGIANQKHDIAKAEDNVYWKTAKQVGILDKISRIGENVAVQGELVGHTIKRNSMGWGPGQHQFFVFDIFDIARRQHRPATEVEAVCKKLDLPHVPVIRCCKLGDFAKNLEELLEKAEGVGMLGKIREGLVFKTEGSDWAFKAIANSWLIEYGQ